MTEGRIDELQARIGVALQLSDRPSLEIEFVIDTGFQGALALPIAAVASFGLPFLQEIDASLADDSVRPVDVYLATIVWEGALLEVQVLAMGRRPLLGTALLANKELVAQFAANGMVTVDDL